MSKKLIVVIIILVIIITTFVFKGQKKDVPPVLTEKSKTILENKTKQLEEKINNESSSTEIDEIEKDLDTSNIDDELGDLDSLDF